MSHCKASVLILRVNQAIKKGKTLCFTPISSQLFSFFSQRSIWNIKYTRSQSRIAYNSRLILISSPARLDVGDILTEHSKLIHFHFIGGEQIAKSVTQIWYSLRLNEEDFRLVMHTLQELIHASSLEDLTRGTMKMEQDHFHKLVQVWRTWFELSSREGDWITEERRTIFESYPGSPEGIKLYLDQIPEEHKESASDWFANGILLPKASRKELTRENVSLTGLPAALLNQINGSYKDVKQNFHCASLLKMYSQYVGHVLKRCVATLSTGQVKFPSCCATVWRWFHFFLQTGSMTASRPQT